MPEKSSLFQSSLVPERLIQAAKIAIAFNNVFADLLWQLYPDELCAIADGDKEYLVEFLEQALDEATPPAPKDTGNCALQDPDCF